MTDETKQLIEQERAVESRTGELQVNEIRNVTASTTFTEAIDIAKIKTVEEASVNDEKFRKEFTEKLKDATIKLAEVEEEKAGLEKQNILYHQELLNTQQELNEQLQAENQWANKEKCREYHYNGVKPILTFVGITEPMNLVVLYFLTAILVPFYLLNKLIAGTIGALISGASDANRPKAVKGFLFTLLAVTCAGLLAVIVYLGLGWLKII
jgi:hypothetical protein